MKKITDRTRKFRNFAAALSLCLIFVYLFLPYLTESVGILRRMSQYLESNEIDPTRYYYTDVDQVKEAENYLETALEQR